MANSKPYYSPVLVIYLPMDKDISEVLASIERFVRSFNQPMIIIVLGDRFILIPNVSNLVLQIFENSMNRDTSWLKEIFTSDVSLFLAVQLNENEAERRGQPLQFKVLQPHLVRVGQMFLEQSQQERINGKILYEEIAACSNGKAETEESSHTAMSQQQTTILAYPVPQQLALNPAVADRGPAEDVLVLMDSCGYLVKVTGDKFNDTVTEGDRVHLELEGIRELVEVVAVTGDLAAIEESWYDSERGQAIELKQGQRSPDLANAGGYLDLSF